MCRCRQPQHQVQFTTITRTNIPPPPTTTPPSSSTSPAPTTPSSTPPPLPPVTFSFIKSFTNLHQDIQQLQPHYYYHQDSNSSSSTPPPPLHEPAIITAEAMVHASYSLPTLHRATLTPPPIEQVEYILPSSTLSRSLVMLPGTVRSMQAKTQSVLEHCSCGLTFAVDHILPISPLKEMVVDTNMPLINNDVQSVSPIEPTYYETISEVPLTQHAHLHHSHHHGHIHYHMNSHEQAQNYKDEAQLQNENELTGV